MIRMFFCWISLFVFQAGFSQGIIDFVFKSHGAKGGIVIQNADATFWAHNNEFEVRKKTPSAATYQLLSFLMVAKEHPDYIHRKKMEWDGVHRTFFGVKKTEWEQSMGLTEAFRTQNDYFFDTLLSKLSVYTRQQIHEQAGYTFPKWNQKIPYYWQFGGLEVTPTDQLALLKQLYFTTLPFEKSHQEVLKNLLFLEENHQGKLYGMFAYTIFNGEIVRWFVGWRETADDVYFFACRTYHSIESELEAPTNDKMQQIVKETFEQLGIW